MNYDGSKLVLREFPIALWIFGSIFAGFGGLILYLDASSVLLGLVFLGVGLAFVLLASTITITADRMTRTIQIDRRSALRRSARQVSFDQIAGIDVERSVSRRKGRAVSTYRVVLSGKDGQAIALQPYSSSGLIGKERLAQQLRDFIGVRGRDVVPAGSFQAAPQHTAETRQTDGIRWQIQPIGMAGAMGNRWYSPDFRAQGAFLCLAQKAEGQASRGLLASLGSMIFTRTLSTFGFEPEDTPGVESAANLSPLDPALEPHFMAYSNAPDWARQILNPNVAPPLVGWATRHSIKRIESGSVRQLLVLFGPRGLYVAGTNMFEEDQVKELTDIGLALIRSQSGQRGHASATQR